MSYHVVTLLNQGKRNQAKEVAAKVREIWKLRGDNDCGPIDIVPEDILEGIKEMEFEIPSDTF